MGIIYNNKNIEAVKYNGNDINKVNYNNTEVFTSGHKLTVNIGNNISRCTCMGKNYYNTFTINIPKGTAVTLSCTPKSTTYSSYTYNPSTASTNPTEGATRSRYSYTYTRQWSGDYVSSSNYNNFTMPDNDINISVSATQSSGSLNTQTYTCVDDGSYRIDCSKFLSYVAKDNFYQIVVGYEMDTENFYQRIGWTRKLYNSNLSELKEALGTNTIILSLDFNIYSGITYGDRYDDHMVIGHKNHIFNANYWHFSTENLKTQYYDRGIFPIPYTFNSGNGQPSGTRGFGGYCILSDLDKGVLTYEYDKRDKVYYKYLSLNHFKPNGFDAAFGTTTPCKYVYINYGYINQPSLNAMYNVLKSNQSSGISWVSWASSAEEFIGYTGNKNATLLQNLYNGFELTANSLGEALDLLNTSDDSTIQPKTAVPMNEFSILVYPAKANTSTVTEKGATLLWKYSTYSNDRIYYAPIKTITTEEDNSMYSLPSTAYDLKLPSGVSANVYLSTSLPTSISQASSGVPIINFQEGSSYKVSDYKYIYSLNAGVGVNYKFTYKPTYVSAVNESDKVYEWR